MVVEEGTSHIGNDVSRIFDGAWGAVRWDARYNYREPVGAVTRCQTWGKDLMG